MVADGAEEEKAAGEKAEEGAEFKTYKEVEINNLIETMKNNYATTNQESQFNLANHYQSIDATHEQFHGRKPDRYDLVAKQTKGEITAKSLVADENVINQPLVSQLGNTVQDFNVRNDPQGIQADYRDVINLGDGNEADQTMHSYNERHPDGEAEEVLFPVNSIKERLQASDRKFDSDAVRDRLLTLKLMFDDASNLRRQRDFMSKTDKDGANQDLGMLSAYNIKKSSPRIQAPKPEEFNIH